MLSSKQPESLISPPFHKSPEDLRADLPEILEVARSVGSHEALRHNLAEFAHRMDFEATDDYDSYTEGSIIRVRDCVRAFIRMLTRRSEDKAEFSIAGAIGDIASGRRRPDLSPAFCSDLYFLLLGLQGKGPRTRLADLHLIPSYMEGREAAVERSKQLDMLQSEVMKRMAEYDTGLSPESVKRRRNRRRAILKELNASAKDWKDWRWHLRNVQRDPDQLSRLVALSGEELRAIQAARRYRLPFGVTPHYLSLMDDDPEAGRDRAIRAQVMPPLSYVEQMGSYDQAERACLDFMRESDTSPEDLITRRYAGICILKPFNTCPQICVYCQRNWEISDAMEPGALASESEIARAVEWIRAHPAIYEVLVTGGDPLAMSDEVLDRILSALAAIPSVERIRIGSRTPVTLPMRITDSLARLLSRYRIPSKRQVSVVTHIQHPYEVTPDTARAVERLRRRGIPVYNQLVYTFYSSRRFEAAFLRRQLALVGVDPYYTFNTKGKEETIAYRVPIARLLQEQKEEARLLPGLLRTDAPVYNVPGLGKNYLRASQHRDLISILPDGSRLYEFHPWEKNISRITSTHLAKDVPILDYLDRLEAIGEDASDYGTIWYYF
jgi:lysine 2,3-aminomutase